MRKNTFNMMVALAAIVGGAQAQTLSVQPTEAQTGEQTALVVSLTGRTAMTGLQFNLQLPEGVTLDETAIAKGEVAGGHTLSISTLDGGDRLFVLYSMNLDTFGDGCLLRLPVTAPTEAGTFSGRLYTVRTASVGGGEAVSHTAEDAAFTVTVQQAEEPEVPIADGTYYLRNVSTQQFWGAANNWGTRASLVDEYQYVTLARLNDGKYSMETMVSNGGNNYYFGGDYMDGQPASLTVEKRGDYYTFALDGNCFGYDGSSTILGKGLAADSPQALWQVMTEEEVKAEQDGIVASATLEAPADVSFLVRDNGFGRNRRDAATVWTMEASNQNLGGGVDYDHHNGCAESYHSVFTLAQTIADAPKGVYKLEAQGFYRQDGTDNEHLPYFYMNGERSAFNLLAGTDNNMTEAGVSFQNGLYAAEPMYVELTAAGTLTVGARLEENTSLCGASGTTSA